MTEVLLVERDGPVVVLTLNRPGKMNALSAELRRLLSRAFRTYDADDEVGAFVLTGAGDRAFTAGIDLTEAAERGLGAADEDENPLLAIERCRKPIVVAVNGVCITGGMEIMLACDVVIASRTARFADTHVRVGLLPGWGISQRLARQVGIQRAKEISLSGNFLDSARAFELGVINRVVEPEDLLHTAKALAHDFASANRIVMLEYKRLIEDGFDLGLREGLALEQERALTFNMRLKSEDFQHGKASASARNRAQAEE